MLRNVRISAKKILIVEDDPVIREYLEQILNDLDYRVDSCSSGAEAMSKIPETCPNLILMDILLPDADGLTLCQKIKKDDETAHIPVIMISCLSDSDTLRNASSYGASDFIVKPFNQAELKEKIEKFIAS